MQFLNAILPIKFKEEGLSNDICERDEHWSKAKQTNKKQKKKKLLSSGTFGDGLTFTIEYDFLEITGSGQITNFSRRSNKNK